MEGYDSCLAFVAGNSIDKGALRIHRLACTVDCGQLANPNIVDQPVSGGIAFGLSAALPGEITLAGGAVQQKNFGDYRLLRLNEMPAIDVHLLPSSEAPGGMGEPSVALVAPALCNAIHAATRRRIRSLPLSTQNVVKV